MGIWEFMYGTTETIKQYTPGLTSIASVASYGYCTSTASSVAKLYGYIPDQDRRSQIRSFAGKFAKNAALYGFYEGYKLIPGGKAVGKIVSMTANDMKSENRQTERDTKVSSKEHRVMESTTQNSPITDPASVMKSTTQNSLIADSALVMKPEDVLRLFMMKEFIGHRFLDDLIVPGAKKSK